MERLRPDGWPLARPVSPTRLRLSASWLAYSALAYPKYGRDSAGVKGREIERSPLPRSEEERRKSFKIY